MRVTDWTDWLTDKATTRDAFASRNWPLTSGYRATQTQLEFCLADSVHCWHCPPIPESRRQMRLKYFLFIFLYYIYSIKYIIFIFLSYLLPRSCVSVCCGFCDVSNFFQMAEIKCATNYINKLKRLLNLDWLQSMTMPMDVLNQSKESLLIIFNSLQIPTQLYW